VRGKRANAAAHAWCDSHRPNSRSFLTAPELSADQWPASFASVRLAPYRERLSDGLIHSLAALATRLADLSRVAKHIDHPHAGAFQGAVTDVLNVIRSLD
jgi:hypothetical protein